MALEFGLYSSNPRLCWMRQSASATPSGRSSSTTPTLQVWGLGFKLWTGLTGSGFRASGPHLTVVLCRGAIHSSSDHCATVQFSSCLSAQFPNSFFLSQEGATRQFECYPGLWTIAGWTAALLDYCAIITQHNYVYTVKS